MVAQKMQPAVGGVGPRATLTSWVSQGTNEKGTAMSFRNNLQHLRATRNMTQEQLAMLVGVSRQSVTKWESERAYPEMDKLLKICDIFGCTLDELVSGDLTGLAAEPSQVVPAMAALADVTGYDEHHIVYATRIASGVAAIIMGVAMAALLDGVALGALSSDALSGLAMFAFIIVGLALIIPAAMDHTAFQRAHPFVESFYTSEQEQQVRHEFGIQLAVGVGIVIAGVALGSAGDNRITNAAFLFFVAIGAFVLVRGGIMAGRIDVEDYNIDALSELTEEEVASIVGEDRAAKVLAKVRRNRLAGSACAIIMILATIVALCLLFYGEYYFWIPWMVGGLLCGVAAIVVGMLGEK